ncbi:hypothetical protein KCP70_19250 [Salmonella enterica subsp. enterica]|nr:hypothetical protein KCP70_19250 [Salmonella enterica subsp. enterica]
MEQGATLCNAKFAGVKDATENFDFYRPAACAMWEPVSRRLFLPHFAGHTPQYGGNVLCCFLNFSAGQTRHA